MARNLLKNSWYEMTPKSNAFYRIAVRGDNGATWLTGLNKAEISSFFACLVCFIAFLVYFLLLFLFLPFFSGSPVRPCVKYTVGYLAKGTTKRSTIDHNLVPRVFHLPTLYRELLLGLVRWKTLGMIFDRVQHHLNAWVIRYPMTR